MILCSCSDRILTFGIKSIRSTVVLRTRLNVYHYSLIDQQHKQTLNFSGGQLLGNFDGQLYVAGNSCVYCLMPQPWTSQVQVRDHPFSLE